MQGRRWPGAFQLTELPAFAGRAPYLTVKFMALEVSLAVPPPYGPPEAGVPGVGYGNRYGAGGSDGRGGDRGHKLFSGYVSGGLGCAVPIHDGISCKAAAVDRQGERWAACIRVVR